jgi:2-polyprenyl-3-methyl-5-hydroxy-6-metoxy-1,4-benzoquinol methylase
MWNLDRNIPFKSSRRIIRPEILDDQTPDSGARSLHDLARINRYLGGHEATRKALRSVAPDGLFTVLDVGAASGDTGEAIRTAFPKATVTSLDYRVHHLRRAAQPKVAADAFGLPFAPRSFDIVHCSLFLHHFKDNDVVALLRGFREAARLAVVVNDLERHRLAYLFLPFTKWLFQWDPITLHDGPISVQAAFTASELRDLAGKAGLRDLRTRVSHPAFRITLTGRP